MKAFLGRVFSSIINPFKKIVLAAKRHEDCCARMREAMRDQTKSSTPRLKAKQKQQEHIHA